MSLAACASAALLAWVATRPAPSGLDPGSEIGPRVPQAFEGAGEPADASPLSERNRAPLAEAATQGAGEPAEPLEVRDGFAHLILLTPSGEPLLGDDPLLDAAGLRLVWMPSIDADHRAAQDVTPIAAAISLREGYWGSIMVTDTATEVVAVVGDDRLLASAELPAAGGDVVLVVDRSGVPVELASLTGVIMGGAEIAGRIEVQPMGPRGLSPAGPMEASVRAEGGSASFRLDHLPPGDALLSFAPDGRSNATRIRELLRTHDLDALSRGRRVSDVAQWNARLQLMREGRVRPAPLRISLRAGETTDVGVLRPEEVAVAVLDLADAAGAPMDAAHVQVVVPAAPARPGIRVPHTLSFESRVAVAPVWEGRAMAYVTRHGYGARVELTGQTDGESITVPMRPLALIVVPSTGAGALLDDQGIAVPMDTRWAGSRYRGVLVGDTTRIVPAGRYSANGAWFDVAPAELATVTESGIQVKSLPDEPEAQR